MSFTFIGSTIPMLGNDLSWSHLFRLQKHITKKMQLGLHYKYGALNQSPRQWLGVHICAWISTISTFLLREMNCPNNNRANKWNVCCFLHFVIKKKKKIILLWSYFDILNEASNHFIFVPKMFYSWAAVFFFFISSRENKYTNCH